MARVDKHPRHARRASWGDRRRSARLRRVPAPANDNRFRMSQAGRIFVYGIAIVAILAVAVLLGW